jgi:membrane protein implicated in regulation of membrane protease activity
MTVDQMVKLVWLALLIIFAVGEGISVGLTSIWFAAGSLCALIAALLGGPLWLQIAVFVVVSALCLLAVRPLAKKYLTPGIQPTNADRIIGQEALVTEDIDDLQGNGAVTIGGVTWTARSGTDQFIPAGTKVKVLRIEGVKVFVESIKEEVKCS